MIPAITNHLWQSTAVAGVAALLAILFRHQPARTRFWIWLAASLKFAIPFAALAAIGERFGWRTSVPASSTWMVFAGEIARPLVSPPTIEAPASGTGPATILFVVWLAGSIAVAILWFVRWRRLQAIVGAASPLDLGLTIETRASSALIEPGVFGIFRPVLVLPEGIEQRLSPGQLAALLAHELCHVRRRDNLFAALHMAIEASFWFHPAAWWIGARLVQERERACDEAVLAAGADRESYADGLLRVCRFYFESRLACAAGVTGGDLKRRIVTIMSRSTPRRLCAARKALLAATALAAVAGPIAVGILNSPRVHAQETAAAARFDVATVKPSAPGTRGFALPPPVNGRLTTKNTPLKTLIEEAYHVQSFQVIGGPDWMTSQGYDVTAKAPGPAGMRQIRPMLQALLAERFKLGLHHENRTLPSFSIVLAKGGHKLVKSADEDCPPTPTIDHPCGGFRVFQRRLVHGEKVTIAELADVLAVLMNRTVFDKTGLDGRYTVKLEWTPDATQFVPAGDGDPANAESGGASIFTAIQQQLGLKLEAGKGPVDVLVIDRAEKPVEN